MGTFWTFSSRFWAVTVITSRVVESLVSPLLLPLTDGSISSPKAAGRKKKLKAPKATIRCLGSILMFFISFHDVKFFKLMMI
jgi:hypothetical protein